MIVGNLPEAETANRCVVLVLGRGRRVEGDPPTPGLRPSDLEPVQIQEADVVLLRRLIIDLHVRVLELGAIDERTGAPHEPHVLDRIRSVEPGLVLKDRSTELAAVVGDLLVVIRRLGRDADRLQLVRHVGRFHRLVVEVSTDVSSILIRSALDDHVHADAARAGLDVVSGRRDLDLFEVVVVEVRRGGAG